VRTVPLVALLSQGRERFTTLAVFRGYQEVMTMAKDHGPTVRNDKLYEDLRRDGASKEKAARIANAKVAGTLDHRSTHLEDRSKDDLEDEAAEIGIEGRSKLDKDELVDAIRAGK
jgi:hypothetical protein